MPNATRKKKSNLNEIRCYYSLIRVVGVINIHNRNVDEDVGISCITDGERSSKGILENSLSMCLSL